ncbi:MAG: hypothetical protein AAFZ65_11330, partial [Planctomycetota bacterium]
TTTTAGPFDWAEGGNWQRLPVFVTANPGDGWFEILPGVKLRQVASKSTDPTYEIVIAAPKSGHPTRDESLLLQLPGPTAAATNQPPPPLVVAFHSFSRSEKEPFNASDLPAECASRGWMLLSPLGLSQLNFASPSSQAALDAALDVLAEIAPFNRQRVYTAGFSMGGASAVSYALRHQDPFDLRVAGVVCHTGTMEVREAVESLLLNVSPQDLPLYEAEFIDIFGALPSDDPFAYDRVSVARFSGANQIEAESVPAWNLVDVPLYFHNDPADISTQLVAQNTGLFNFLSGLGFDVLRETNLSFCNGFQSHNWCSLKDGAALDFIASATAPGATPTFDVPVELHVDRQVPYRLTEVRELEPGVYGRVTVGLPNAGANNLALSGIRGVRELAVDLDAASLDANAILTLQVEVEDAGASVRFVLEGYPMAPTQVLIDGVPASRKAWQYDARNQELLLPPTSGQQAATYRVIP